MKKLGLWCLVAAAAAGRCAPQNEAGGQAECTAAQRVGTLPPELTEASGIAVGRRTPGILWAHNDSGEPMLFALDSTGGLIGRVRVPGVANEDWEDIAAGPCGSGTCL